MSALATIDEGQLVMDLTELEQNTLQVCEEIIERNLKAFIETGDALLAIRDGRLYRATHNTFEDYCLNKWGLKQSRAYQLMDAAEVVHDLKSSTIVELPANEAQARPLTSIETPEERREVWKEAVETAPEGKVTAAHVQAVADRHTGKDLEKQQAEAAKEAAAEKAVDSFMDAPASQPEPEETVEEASEDVPPADDGARQVGSVIDDGPMPPETLATSEPLPVTDNRAATKEKVEEPKAATSPPAPTPSDSGWRTCLMPSSEYEWMTENGYTPATAVAALRELRPQLYNATLSLSRPQLTAKAERALEALVKHHGEKHPNAPILPAMMLETVLAVRCGMMGIELSDDDDDESEETDHE